METKKDVNPERARACMCTHIWMWRLTDPLSVLCNSCSERPPFFSHSVIQRTSKLMEGWPVAQRHDRLAGSPELEPLAWGLQAWGWRLTGPGYEGLMNGFWHSAGDVCAFVCVHAHSTRAFRETFWLAVASGRMRQISFRSSHRQMQKDLCKHTPHNSAHHYMRGSPEPSS